MAKSPRVPELWLCELEGSVETWFGLEMLNLTWTATKINANWVVIKVPVTRAERSDGNHSPWERKEKSWWRWKWFGKVRQKPLPCSYITKVGQAGANVDWGGHKGSNVTFHMKTPDSIFAAKICYRLNVFGLFSPIRTQGKLEMATPKENMKRKMKTTIAQDISFSSTSKCACLWKDL